MLFLALLMALPSGCEESSSSDDTPSREPRRRKKKKREKRSPAAASASAAMLPPLPPVSPSVRTDPPPDLNAPVQAEVTPSGLATRVLKRGTGTQKVGPNDTVTVHYSGWTLDGNMFDSSVPRGTPASFGVDKVIPGWTEALQLMVEGERRRVWIPAELAYGVTPKAGRPAGRLVFDIELIKVKHAPAAPPDVAAPPAKATRTKSGLAYIVLRKGTSSTHPGPTSKVEVHYTGWTTDGKMFDSSVMREKSSTFPLGSVIKGWTEALQLMSPGDVFRVWIPGELGYGNTPRPGRPSGLLVFDIELIAIH